MKKKSKVIGKDYEKLDLNNACDQFDFYGLILRDDRGKVDTKRSGREFWNRSSSFSPDFTIDVSCGLIR